MSFPLPLPMQELIEELGFEVSEALDITDLNGPAAIRRTYRLRLADGRVIKGRILSSLEMGKRMRRWLPVLDDRFPKLIALQGRATLEEWIDGRGLGEIGRAHV